MIFAIELKKNEANASIFDIIINKLCYKKKSYLIISFEVNKSLKTSFYCTI